MKRVLKLLLLAACAGCAAPGGMKLPDLSKMQLSDIKQVVDKVQQVQQATRDFTEPEEIALGQDIASNMLGAAPLLAERKVQRYVNEVGLWLAMHTERPQLAWHFAVLDDNELNAFAAPGGYIFITRGLLAGLKNEAELAGVLAHEIAHVLRRHHLQAIKKAAGSALVAEYVNASLAASSNQLGPLLSKLAGAGTELYARGLDKGDEFEADRMGVVIAARAGYDPYGLPAVLQALQTVSPEHAGLALMFKTHPAFAARLDMLELAMGAPFDRFDKLQTLAPRFKTAMLPARPGK